MGESVDDWRDLDGKLMIKGKEKMEFLELTVKDRD